MSRFAVNRRAAATVAAALACWACAPGSGGQEAKGEQTGPEAGAVPAALPPGEYRLAGADGREVDLGWAVTVSVTADQIALHSQCVTPRWSYRFAGGALRTQAIPVPFCDRGYYPAEEAAIAVLDSPQEVTRMQENGLRIDGGGHSILLFLQ